MIPSRWRASGLRATAFVGLAATCWALKLADQGALAIPLSSVEPLGRWVRDTPPPLMAVALLRLAAFGACAYLGAVLALYVVADAAGWRRIAAAAARALPTTLRRAALSGAQLGFAAGAVLSPANPVAAAPRSLGDELPPATATMAMLDNDAEWSPPPATAVMVHLGPAHPRAEPDPTVSSAPSQTSSVQQPPMDPAVASSAPETWMVGTGDSFWSIAETLVAEASAPDPPSDDEIARYWRQLITANTDRLVAPHHPDLLIPGQTLVIPPPA